MTILNQKRPKLTKEEKERNAQYLRWRKEDRENEKMRKEEERENEKMVRKSIAILKYMIKTDVINYHHGRGDSSKERLKQILKIVQEEKKWNTYHPYIWNYQGEGNNYIAYVQMDCLWSGRNGFNSIFDVPLDGSFIFQIHDSGQRGLGSWNYISANPKENEPVISKVNPGSIIPITVN